MSIYVSLVNLVASASAITATTEAAGFEDSNLATPERPMLPWRSTVTTDTRVVVDFGASISSTTLLIAPARANFDEVKIQGNATDSWGSPSYNPHSATNLAIPRNPWSGRYIVGHLAAAWTYRYLSLFIPSQTPIIERDGGATPTYFSLGGLHAGIAETLPRAWRWEYRLGPHRPALKVGPAHGGWDRTVRLGVPRMELNGTLQLEINGEAPGIGDQLATWLDMQRRMHDRGPFAVMCDYGEGETHSFLAEDLSGEPEIDYPMATISLRWVECV